jgi:hypothetical protein
VDNFEDHLKNQAEGFKITPSDRVWEGVKAGLRGKKRTPFWWYGAALILLTGFSLLVYRNYGPTLNDTVKNSIENNSSRNETTATPTISQDNTATDNTNVRTEITPPGNVPETIVSKPAVEKAPALNEKTFVALSAPLAQQVQEEKHDGIATLPSLKLNTRSEKVFTQEQIGYNARPVPYRIAPSAQKLRYTVSAGFVLTTPVSAGYKAYLKPGGGWNLQAGVTYALNHSVGLSAGIGFTQKRYNVGVVSITPETIAVIRNDGDTLSQSASFKLSNESHFRNINRQLSIPVAIHYDITLNSSGARLGVFSGFEFSRVFAGRYLIKSESSDRLFINKGLLNPYNTNFNVGIGYSPRIGDTNRLVFRYTASYQLGNSYHPGYGLREHLFSNTLSAGFSF